MEAKMEMALAKQRAELTAVPAQEAISDAQLAALQVRLEALHSAQLLSDEEMWAVEDLIADATDDLDDDRVPSLLALSASRQSRAQFARIFLFAQRSVPA